MRDLYEMLGQEYTSAWYKLDNSAGTAADAAQTILKDLGLLTL